MDPGGPGSRTGRTFWTFWNYITDIVGRFLRAEPPGTEKNATNNVKSTPTNDELLDSHHKDNATEEREEVHVDPAFSVGSTRPVVLWDTGSELQPEMRQNIEQDKMNENDDGKKDKEIETGNDVVTYLPISSTTIDNPEQSSDVIRNDEELMPKILVDSQDEMINIDMKVSKQYCSEEANKPQSKEQLNAISKEGFNEQNTYSAVEPELTSEDTKTVKQTCCEQHDGKLLLSDNMDLEECVSIIEKQEHVEADGNEESASVKSDRDGNKNAMEGTAEIKNMTDEDRYRETMCYDVLQNTHLELTQQNTCMIEVTHSSDEGLNRMNTEDMKKPHSLVLETENLCKQDDISEAYEEDVVMMQNNPDIENLEKLSDMESLMSDNTCVIVESEDDEKETEFQKEEIEMMENDDDTMTNQNAAFDLVDGNNAKETCPALIIDKDITQTCTLEETDGESSTEEPTDMNKDDLNKLHSSMVLETENMSKQDDKNEVHDDNKDDKVLTQNNLDIENLERSSDMESLMSDNTYVTVLEEKESHVKQELTVAITADDSVKSEDAEKESEIQKEEIEMMENDNDNVTNTNASFDSEDGNNTVIDQDMIQTCTLEETDDESSTEESTDMNKDDLKRQDNRQEIEIMENDDDTMTNQNAAFDLVDGNNAKETCPALIIDKDITQTCTLEETDGESSTEEPTDMNKDDLNKLHSSMVLETENMSKQDDKNEVHDENKDDKVLTQNNLDIENLEKLSDMESLMSDHTYVIVLEEKESRVKQELTVAITADDSVKSEDAEKESEIQKEEIEMMENDNVTNTNAPFDSEDGNNAKETCPALILDKDITQTYTLEVTDGESSTEEPTDMNKDDLNKLHSSMVLETENMSKQDDKNEVHDENKDDKVLTQNNLDIENLERTSDMESLMPDHTYVIVLEEKESRVKQELTVANTTDDSVKLEDAEKESENQKEEIEMMENDNDNVTNTNASFDSEDGNNTVIDQDMIKTCTLEVTDDESSTEESTDMNKDDLKRQDNRQEIEMMENDNDDVTNTNAPFDSEDGNNTVIDQDMIQTYTLEVTDGESSTEESTDMNKDDLNKLHSSMVLETENMSKQDDKNEVHDENKDDKVLTLNNLDIENLERSSDMESLMPDHTYVIVLEEKESRVKQELTVANTTDDSGNVKSENSEKENEIQTEQSEMTEYDDDSMTSQNAELDSEDGNNAKETCPEPIVDLPFTTDVKSITEESKDLNKDSIKLHTFFGLETEILSILDNQTVQDEYSKVQVTDECNIQEVEPCTSKREHTAAIGKEKPGKMEQDIFEEESDNKDFKTKVITPNMDDAANVDLETHISRCGLDFKGFFNVADPASSEMGSSMGKFDVTIKSEGGPTQEQAIAFKNIPLGEGEGQERPYSYKESREEVPDYNNDSNNGSATQRFLEVTNCRENQTTLLQEEVESRATKHLQTSATSEGEGSLEDPMETQLIKNSLEERTAEKTRLSDMLMKTTSEYSNFETNFMEDVDEKGEDLKEAEKEIGYEMRKGLCDIDTLDADVEMQTGFQNLISLDQNEYNVQMLERPFVETETTRTDLLDVEEGLFTFEEDVTVVKKISDGSSESVKSGSADEDCTTVSNDNVIPDVVHYEISPDALSVEDEHQKCALEQQIFDDVIEDEILDLWIQHTSMESSEVTEEDQGYEESLCKIPEEEKVESMPELSIECDVNVSLLTTESGFSDQSLNMETSHECNKEEQDSLKEEQITNVSCASNKSEGINESSLAEPELETPWREDLGTTPESTDDADEAITSQNIDSIMSLSTPVMQDNNTCSVQMDDKEFTTLGTVYEPETLTTDQSDFFTELKNTIYTTDTYETEERQLLEQDKSKVEALLEFERMEDMDKVDVKELDFTPQKSRIAVKNPKVRPPKDFRLLLHKPSLEPSPSKPMASHVPTGVPVGGLGIGIKLPGLGTGFPILKKTRKTAEEETQATTQEKEPIMDDGDKVKQEDSPQRPKWKPPNHPGSEDVSLLIQATSSGLNRRNGLDEQRNVFTHESSLIQHFGNPLLSELKSKLKKTTKE